MWNEAVTYYDTAKGCRPYVYIFPYIQCPFKQNAIDVAMKAAFSEHQLKIHKETERKRENKSGSTSGVQFFQVNN